jgi:hypothetical protein
MVEWWNGGTVERWNGGTVERWNGGTSVSVILRSAEKDLRIGMDP